jgi:hypothetical protein
MGSHDQIDPIQHTEVINNSMPENPSGTSGVSLPSFDILRVRPHKVSHGSFMGNLLLSVDKSHLVDRWQIRR